MINHIIHQSAPYTETPWMQWWSGICIFCKGYLYTHAPASLHTVARYMGWPHRNYFTSLTICKSCTSTALRNQKGDVLGGIDAIRN